ncbi:hypothetical protein [Demequina mangrovi]|uniref:Uncharacterized protein n=1 Tax=Demequina mangrovi TaxID=1043493 RepID=A0A1H7AHM4_9MICO|nr:hypothetical protein [Demequina mangrovi]SEJ64426.1 hypothetical protein SAMN05421637_2546 [Demequina mangrovi]
MAESKAPDSVASPALRWLGYLGLLLGFGTVVLTVDSGSVSVMGFSFDIAVPIIAAVAFVGGMLAARFGPRKGEL